MKWSFLMDQWTLRLFDKLLLFCRREIKFVGTLNRVTGPQEIMLEMRIEVEASVEQLFLIVVAYYSLRMIMTHEAGQWPSLKWTTEVEWKCEWSRFTLEISILRTWCSYCFNESFWNRFEGRSEKIFPKWETDHENFSSLY